MAADFAPFSIINNWTARINAVLAADPHLVRPDRGDGFDTATGETFFVVPGEATPPTDDFAPFGIIVDWRARLNAVAPRDFDDFFRIAEMGSGAGERSHGPHDDPAATHS